MYIRSMQPITHPSPSSRHLACLRCLSLLCLLLFWAARLHAQDAASGFSIEDARVSLRDGVYHLDADMRLAFSDEALEALASGVPLTLLLDMRVMRERDYWWNAGEAGLEQRYELSFHALSDKYLVKNINSGSQQSMRTLGAANGLLGRVRGLPVIDRKLLDPAESYLLEVRVELDINALPAPMRPLAWLSRDWRLSSEWFRCPLPF